MFTDYSVTAELVNLYLIQGHNSCITNCSLTKIYLHNCFIIVHLQFKFHELLIIDYLLMANLKILKSI